MALPKREDFPNFCVTMRPHHLWDMLKTQGRMWRGCSFSTSSRKHLVLTVSTLNILETPHVDIGERQNGWLLGCKCFYTPKWQKVAELWKGGLTHSSWQAHTGLNAYFCCVCWSYTDNLAHNLPFLQWGYSQGWRLSCKHHTKTPSPGLLSPYWGCHIH